MIELLGIAQEVVTFEALPFFLEGWKERTCAGRVSIIELPAGSAGSSAPLCCSICLVEKEDGYVHSLALS